MLQSHHKIMLHSECKITLLEKKKIKIKINIMFALECLHPKDLIFITIILIFFHIINI